MTYRGTVRNGKIELEADVHLPEGAIVKVEPLASADPADDLPADAVDTGLTDLAARHDHYIYGPPSRDD
ncbi:MAG: hypothetical protein AB1716_20220 [Planctomycetota bacterium]